jgi:hypothetical protein
VGKAREGAETGKRIWFATRLKEGKRLAFACGARGRVWGGGGRGRRVLGSWRSSWHCSTSLILDLLPPLRSCCRGLSRMELCRGQTRV